MSDLTKEDVVSIRELGFDAWMDKRIETGDLDEFEVIIYFKKIPIDVKKSIAQKYIDSLRFKDGCYNGAFGARYDSSFSTGVMEISFVDDYQDIIRDLGYAVSFNSWNNWGAFGRDFKITEKKEYTKKDNRREIIGASMFLIAVIATLLWFLF